MKEIKAAQRGAPNKNLKHLKQKNAKYLLDRNLKQKNSSHLLKEISEGRDDEVGV
jgi:hypothetical protein